MERQTFVLAKTKPFRHHLKLYVRDSHGKTTHRIVTFTTEHLVSEKERVTNARKKAAQFSTSDPIEVDALLRDTGYGKTFYLKGDEKGERKLESFNITPTDVKKIALQNLFVNVGLEFDGEKSAELLQEELRLFLSAKTGTEIGSSTASQIPHIPVDVKQTIDDKIKEAHAKYETLFGEPIPEELKNDLAFLDGLSNPDFNAKEYIASKGIVEPGEDDLPDDPEALGEIYFQLLGKKVAIPMKNNIEWIKSKIKEVQS